MTEPIGTPDQKVNTETGADPTDNLAHSAEDHDVG